MNNKKLKTLKDLKIKNPYQIERLILLFEHGVYHTKKAVRTELGLKRIVKLQKENEKLYNKPMERKDYRRTHENISNIELLMEVFNITKEDIEKFKEENK